MTGSDTPDAVLQTATPDGELADRLRKVLDRRGRSPEELLNQIAELLGSPRRFRTEIYQKSLG